MQQQCVEPPVAWPAAPPRDLVKQLGPTLAFFLDTYLRHGPVVRLQMGPGKELLVLSGVAANQFVSRSGQNCLRMADFRQDQNRAYGASKTMVSSDGAEHRRLRKLQKQGYSRDVLAEQGATIAALVAEEQSLWAADPTMPVVAMATRLTGRLIGSCVLSHDPQDGVADLTNFLQTVIRVTLAGNQPATTLTQPAFLHTRQQAHELAETTIAAHGCPAHGRRQDLVDDLIAAATADSSLFSAADLNVAVLGPYIGGLEPVANTLAFALYALVQDQALAARVCAEVRTNLSDPAACVDRLDQMPTLRALVQETLRRYPVTPVLRGTTSCEFELEGYHIQAGQDVAIGIAVPHVLPEHFPEPLNFDIDRFVGTGAGQRTTGSYAPFGLGSHACLGAGLAETLLQAVIAVILVNYNLTLDPAEYQLQIESTTTPAPDQQFRVRLSALSG